MTQVHRPDDEAFWRTQEKRREKRLGQPCCTQSGISWTLIDMPGNFAVVIHGEYDCVNCFKHNGGRSAWRYYSTRLTEGQLTSGETHEPLERCLRLIVAEEAPEAIVVLGTCPVEVIGDRFERVVEVVSAETGVPMVALHTSGLKLSSQQVMIDWCYDTLASLGGDPPLDNKVALVGMPIDRRGQAEVRQICAASEVELLGQFPMGASLEDWKALPGCKQVLVTDPTMQPKLMERLAGRGQVLSEVPLPFGRDQSLAVYAAIGASVGAELGPALADWKATADAAVEGFRRDHGGTRMALSIRMHNSNRSDFVARDGLGAVGLFRELGVDLTLLIQGSPDADMLDVWRGLLDDNGLADVAFDVFPGPYAIGETLKRGNFALACVADWVHREAATAGIPILFTHQLQPWLGGVAPNVARLRRLLEQP